ncbi:MlaD family protein [Nocardia aurantia]|uniref:MCE family protein n=1 Tax=Nocardia aurantia TaxID=2585199 RepID=A0A7K0E139_9NOCA|nr:MlaD family protein [Nocardia aurantia]MQY31715.1 hypothetical protein [Nocardia aurantia]
MQRMTVRRNAAGAIPRHRRGTAAPVTAARTERRQLRLGLIGAALVLVCAVAAGLLYVVPFGKKTYTAELSEAQSVQTGDDVRVAGIIVGSVKSLQLKPDRVVMRFTVDSGVFVGDESTLDVRMLTVIGGHYVALFPSGSKPLGGKAIPPDRVRLPYSLTQTFQDAIRPLRTVDGDTLRRNLSALDSSIEQAPDALRTTLDTVNTYVDALNRQRSQVSAALSVADEYVTMYDGAKTDLGRLMDSVNLLENVLVDKRAELREGIRLLQAVIDRLAALAPTWNSTLEPKLRELTDALPRLEQLGGQLEPVIGTVADLRDKVRGWMTPDGVTVDQSGQTVTAPAGADPLAALPGVCVPVPGRDC